MTERIGTGTSSPRATRCTGSPRTRNGLFVAHLATCPQCQASVDDHELVAAALGAIAHSREPLEAPSWESMRQAVVGDEPADGAGCRAVSPTSSTSVPGDARYAGSRRVLAAPRPSSSWPAGGIVAWRVTAGGSSSGPSPLASCAAQPGCHMIALETASRRAGRVAHGPWRHDHDDPDAHAPAPAGTEYVLWQQPTDGRPVAVKVFTATGERRGRHRQDRRRIRRHHVVRGEQGAVRAGPGQPDHAAAGGG